MDHNVSNDKFSRFQNVLHVGFLFTDPIPTKETIGKYYKSETYISHSGTKKGFINFPCIIVRNYQLYKKEQLISALTKEKNLLDIGCGTGEFLTYCNNVGWQTYGTEPDKKARKNIKNSFVYSNLWAQPN